MFFTVDVRGKKELIGRLWFGFASGDGVYETDGPPHVFSFTSLARATKFAKLLHDNGIKNVTVYVGGWE